MLKSATPMKSMLMTLIPVVARAKRRCLISVERKRRQSLRHRRHRLLRRRLRTLIGQIESMKTGSCGFLLSCPDICEMCLNLSMSSLFS